MPRYRRPRPVSDSTRAAGRLLDARTALITLILGPTWRGQSTLEIDGRLAVEITNAIETLEAAAENYGAVRELAPRRDHYPITPEEIDGAVFRTLAELRRDAGIE
jgi:hypothetical protein